MKYALAAFATLACLAWAAPSLAQNERPGPPNNAPSGAARQGEAAGARQQAPAEEKPKVLGAPFTITKEQYEYLFRVLKAWEVKTSKIDLLRCEVTLWKYDTVFDKKEMLTGELKFQSPDMAVYKVKDKDGNWVEDWMCDGKSLYHYEHTRSQVIQRTIPADLRGKAIAEGPLPFFFGAKAERIIDRYYMRVVTPEAKRSTEVWLEAYPKHQQDAANFQRVTIIITIENMLPFAVETYMPGGKERTVHRFDDVKIGKGLLEGVFGGDDFEPVVPRGWVKVVDPEKSAAPRVGAQPPGKGGAPMR